RHSQGWVGRVSSDLDEIFRWVDEYRKLGEPLSIAYYGNIVDLLEYIDRNGVKAELISDQTSCHAVYEGGYTPAGLSFEEGRELLTSSPDKFKEKVDESLKKHYRVIRSLTEKG